MKMFNTLHPVWVGIATKDIVYGSKVLNVKPIEPLPSSLGDVIWEESEEEVTVKFNGAESAIKINKTTGMDCSWLNLNSNRVTPPDVMAGERLYIWRNADSEDYYWESIDVDNKLRTLEHVIFAFSNTNLEDRADKVLTAENSYLIEVDTRNKKLGIYTNKNDGEPFAYSIKLDTKLGNYKLNDDVGNHILLDSANTVIEFINKDLTQYRMDKKDIIEKCLGNRTLEIGGNNTVIVGGTQSTEVGGSTTLTTPNYTCNIGTTTFTGKVTIEGLLLGSGGMESSSVKAGSIKSDATDAGDLVSKSFNYP